MALLGIFSSRAATLFLSLLGALINGAVAFQLLSVWRVLKWENDSEWEGAVNGWRVDSIKLVWVLLLAYFATAAFACVIGVVGVIKRNAAFVRLYRDYSVADLCFCALITVFSALASFRPGARAAVCEEMSSQPELLHDLAEAGLNLENCELWFEHAVVAVVGITAILLVVRLQFILTVSNYYNQLRRQRLFDSIELCGSGAEGDRDSNHQRIFLLPPHLAGTGSKGALTNATVHGQGSSAGAVPSTSGGVLVYAPVPLDELSEEQARELEATEAWVARRHSRSHSLSRVQRRSQSATRRHGHGHGHSHSHSHTSRGRISLPIDPDEGLLPWYRSTAVGADVKA